MYLILKVIDIMFKKYYLYVCLLQVNYYLDTSNTIINDVFCLITGKNHFFPKSTLWVNSRKKKIVLTNVVIS